MNYKCTTIKSPQDSRDFIADEMLVPITTFPTDLDLRGSLQPIRNQGSQGTCAAQTAACCKEWHETMDIGLKEHFSPQFIYNHRVNKTSEGMYGRDVMKILNQIGAVRERDFPYGTMVMGENISQEIKTKAENFKIKSYARIHKMSVLKTSLHQNGPCYIALPCYNYGNRFWKQEDGDKSLGGHAVAIVGYTKEGFILRNSWGEKWGDNGYCIYHYEDWGSHWEIWTVLDSKSKRDEKPIPETNEITPCSCCIVS